MSSPRGLPFVGTARSSSEKKLKPIQSQKSSLFLRPHKAGGFLNIIETHSPLLTLSPSPIPSERLEFFDSYKNLPKYYQKYKRNLECSPRLAYLEDLQRNHLQPKPFGMTSYREDKKIDLQFFSIGDSYAHAFSEGLKHFKTLESLNLRSNRLSEKGAYQILSNLHYHPVRYLSLSDNFLGEKSIECILSILKSPKPYLKHLNLENTKISYITVNALASVLCTNKSLVHLGLAKNNLQFSSCKALKEMLNYNEKLIKLDLHWNCIKGEGAALIFEGLSENLTLEELDLSWNSIGSNKNNDFIPKIGACLSSQKHLKHLDISYNYIDTHEAETLSESLKSNHTLTGLHVAGNDCEIDAQGFLIPKKQSELEHGHFFTRIIDSPRYSHKTKMNCWICEKWKEAEFSIKSSEAGPVFLHLSVDGYKPQLLKKNETGYSTRRAIPPDETKFFFSHKFEPILSQTHKLASFPEPLDLEVEFWPGCNVTLKLIVVNTINSKDDLIFFSEIESVRPREPSLKYVPPEEELVRIQWSLETSLFKEYNFMTKKTVSDCFEFDWALSKIPNLVKNPLQLSQIHDFLHEIYEPVIWAYKHLSAMSGNEIFSVTNYVLIDFLNECKAVDSLYGVEDVGVNWNVALSSKDKNLLYNPGNALVRFQFLEILIRISNDRYVRNKISGNIIDAARKLFNELLLPIMTKYNMEWRSQVYLTEDVDLVYKAHKPIIEAIFKKYSGRKSLPGQKYFMSIEEFRDLCRDAKFENEKCTNKEIDLAFILAVSVQVDEVNKKRHLEMNFVEFLEALARVCDVSGSCKKYPMGEKSQIEDLYSPRKDTLSEVVEEIMPNLLKLCPPTLRDSFVFPTSETYKKMMYRQPD